MHVSARRLPAFVTIDDLAGHDGIENVEFLVQDQQVGIASATLSAKAFAFAPVTGAYTLIQWALKGKTEGDGYGFPFDRPHLTFAQRLQRLNADVERIQAIHLRGAWRDNTPYFKIHIALQPLIAMPDFPEKLVNMLQKAVA